MKWGEGAKAKLIGFKRKEIIEALDGADKNNEKAEKILKLL